ncbi:MAG: hypothetical protein ACX94B_07865 [Henriciella sp.]
MRLHIVSLTVALLLAGCAGTARMGDEALRYGSMNRVQATPFSDLVDAQDCKRILTEAFGVPHRSVDFDHGVEILQTFECQGATIEAQVRLNNRNSHAMVCAPMLRTDQPPVWIAPRGTAFLNYAVNDATGVMCKPPPLPASPE